MTMFIFGLGYAAEFFTRHQLALGNQIVGTVRSGDKAAVLTRAGLTVRVFSPEQQDQAIADDLARSDAVLISIPPGNDGDVVLAAYADAIATAKLSWIGYLSTVGVYGDHDGAWVDEATPVAPQTERSRRRAIAERAWLAFGEKCQTPVHLFRLAGIYGPGKNQLVQLAQGKARQIIKPGQVFNRIHVEDIASVLTASLRRPRAGATYNVTDNEPAPPQDVVRFAARLRGEFPPPELPFAAAELTPMARSFYSDNKRVRNRLLRDELGVTLTYPTYREGLRALHAAEVSDPPGRSPP